MNEHSEELVRMANQIAHYFAGYPEEVCVAGVRRHIEKFWTPDMRALLEELAEMPDSGLEETVRLALHRIGNTAPRLPGQGSPESEQI
jgi:formate dehydrogenase subunit delta